MEVPSHVLVPPEAYARSFAPHEAALVLDGWLRRLAAREAQCRTVLGTLARRFLARRGHHALGFALLRDYSRERIGISARELQSLATVSTRLEGLPRLGAAFAEGILNWAQLRLLTTVATADTEVEWLEIARGRTVRALAELIRSPRDDHEGDEADDARFRLRCPRRVRRLWQQVVELARRMAGSELTYGQAAEAVAAEGPSARPACGETWPGPVPARRSRRIRPRRGPSSPTSTGAPCARRSRRTSPRLTQTSTASIPSPSTRACATSRAPCAASTGRPAGSSASSSTGGSTG